jgi:uncharacterized protein (DUF58 family)
MLYPDFDDLVSYKKRKSDLAYSSSRSIKSSVPGNYHSPFRGQGLEFDSVREYVPGDDIRNIDWRVTARMGAPHLKLFKEDRERHMLICVDVNASMRFGTRNTFKSVQAARLAALLGWRGIAQQDRVSACLFGDVPKGIQYFPPKRTQKSFCNVLKMLVDPPREHHETSLDDVIQHVSQSAHSGSLIYIISDFMDLGKSFQEATALSRLNKKCDIIFISMNDPADKLICPLGTVGFRANDTDKIYINTDSIAGRKAYAEQWEENRRQLHEMTSRLKIPVLELTTESDIHRDLTLGLKYIAKRKSR